MKYSTTQPVCSLKEGNNHTYFFFEDDAIPGEYLIENKDIRNIEVKNGSYRKEKDRYYSYERFSQEIDAILQYLISHQIALEVNTAGLRMLGFTNPHPDVIRRYREMGGELITVGSDGHVPEYLGYGFDRLPELLSDCGFDSYTVFRQGKPEFRKVLVKI